MFAVKLIALWLGVDVGVLVLAVWGAWRRRRLVARRLVTLWQREREARETAAEREVAI
jgi:hypothetical protein